MRRHGLCVLAALLGGMGAAHADPNGSTDSFLSGWAGRAEAALESQPHWIPTLNTISPRLTQVVRYDQYWESTAGGGAVDSFDSGKGFEFIPQETTSFTINPAPYLERNNHDPAAGWGDWSLLLVKQRLAAANESEGNYIVTALFGVQAPAGSAAFTNHAWVFTPGIGFGKGWGDFDVQGSIAAALPASRATDIGTAVTTNLTLQYHLSDYLWPEVEFNDAAWTGGPRDGRNQMFMTIGSVFGNLPLTDGYKMGLGLGYQFALTPRYDQLPPTPLYDHNWILSLRLVY